MENSKKHKSRGNNALPEQEFENKYSKFVESIQSGVHVHRIGIKNIGSIYDVYLPESLLKKIFPSGRLMVMFVLDISSSMYSSFKPIIDSIADCIVKLPKGADVSLVTFADGSFDGEPSFDFTGFSRQDIVITLRKVMCNWWGSTDLLLGLKRTKSLLKKINAPSRVIFITDGEDSTNADTLTIASEFKYFYEEIRTRKYLTTFDFICYNEIPPRIACRIQKKMNYSGTVHLVEDNEGLNYSLSCINSIANPNNFFTAFIGGILWAEEAQKLETKPPELEKVLNSLQKSTDDQIHRVRFSSAETHFKHFYLESSFQSGIVLETEGARLSLGVNSTNWTTSLAIEDYQIIIESYLKCALFLTAKVFSSLRKEEMKRMKKIQEVLDCSEDLTSVLSAFANIIREQCSQTQRKFLFRKILEGKTYIANLVSSLKEVLMGANPKIMVRLSKSVLGVSVNQGLQKRIDLRMIKNITTFERLKNKMESIRKTTNFLSEPPLPFAKEIKCAITNKDSFELAPFGDVLGIALKVSRSKSAIADPAKTKILHIFPFYVSMKLFSSRLSSEIKKNYSIEQLLGKMDGWSGEGVSCGPQNEKISGVFPVFINEAVWGLTNIHIRRSLGTMTTLSYLGFEYNQLVTVPFLILSKAIAMQKGGSLPCHCLQAIKETCKKIFIQESNPKHSKKLSEETLAKVDEYLNDPSARTIDRVPSNEVFLMQIYIGQECNYIPEFEEAKGRRFSQIMFEEEARRVIKVKKNHKKLSTKQVFSLLGISKATWVDEYVKVYRDKLTSASASESENQKKAFKEAVFSAKVSGFPENLRKKQALFQEEEKKEEQTPKNEPKSHVVQGVPSWKGNQVKLTKITEIFQGLALKGFSQWGEKNIQHLNLVFKDKKLLKDLSPESFGIDTNEKRLALCLQNFYHYQNYMRKAALAKGEHKDPFNQKEAEQFLEEIGRLFIRNRRLKETKMISDAHALSMLDDAVEFFVNHPSIWVAAGALKGVLIGRNIMSFYRRLLKAGEKAKSPGDKILLLINGEFEGHSLIMDKNKHTGVPLMWKMSQKNFVKLFKVFHQALDIATWASLAKQLKLKGPEELVVIWDIVYVQGPKRGPGRFVMNHDH